MSLFRRKTRQHYFLELFKITDKQGAIDFNTQKLVFQAIGLVEKFTGKKADDFNLNYAHKSYKTVEGFKSRFEKYNEVANCFVGFNTNEAQAYFTVSNPMLNYINNAKRPNYSAIDISFVMDEELIRDANIQMIADEIIKRFSFEYGYIHNFPSNRYGGERKVKKGLFSTSVSVSEMDLFWTNNLIGIKDGHIKKPYLTNYLNKSQRSNPILSRLIHSFGESEQISENMLRWKLTNDELKTLNSLTDLSDACIITDDLGFRKNRKLSNDKL